MKNSELTSIEFFGLSNSDVYVRDHLLIQFMVHYMTHYNIYNTDIEEVYQEWIKWKKEQEERHDEGSKI